MKGERDPRHAGPFDGPSAGPDRWPGDLGAQEFMRFFARSLGARKYRTCGSRAKGERPHPRVLRPRPAPAHALADA